MIRTVVRNASRRRVLAAGDVGRIAKAVFESHRIRDAECSVTFVSDGSIRRLNRVYLKRDRPTDVIAFRFGRGGKGSAERRFLGDVVISADRARAYAKRFGAAYRDELALYVVHGILHLLGHDDTGRKKRAEMRAKERSLMGSICARLT